MTQEEIIAMAKEAGSMSAAFWPDDFTFLMGVFERFAALVAESEREACAKVCDELAKMAATPESAACWMRLDCATAIRKRGSA